MKFALPEIYKHEQGQSLSITEKHGLIALMETYNTSSETQGELENIIINFKLFYDKVNKKVLELCTKYKIEIDSISELFNY